MLTRSTMPKWMITLENIISEAFGVSIEQARLIHQYSERTNPDNFEHDLSKFLRMNTSICYNDTKQYLQIKGNELTLFEKERIESLWFPLRLFLNLNDRSDKSFNDLYIHRLNYQQKFFEIGFNVLFNNELLTLFEIKLIDEYKGLKDFKQYDIQLYSLSEVFYPRMREQKKKLEHDISYNPIIIFKDLQSASLFYYDLTNKYKESELCFDYQLMNINDRQIGFKKITREMLENIKKEMGK